MEGLELLTHLYRAHPWHGVHIGRESPREVNTYVEIVPTDSVKYELDKTTGILKVDRPQKFSNFCPAFYGMIPQTYCMERVGDYCKEKTGRTDIVGDGDPLDICIFGERPIERGDILLRAIPIGGFRMIDNGQADDKIIAVLADDLVYGHITDVEHFPTALLNRLRHYFLTYKEVPTEERGDVHRKRQVEIVEMYDCAEACKVIELSHLDYQDHFRKIYEQMGKCCNG
jgi:inorganic pyrophosphatase